MTIDLWTAVERQRLLIVTSGIPSRTTGASTVLFYQYIAALKAAGYDLMHLIVIEGAVLDRAALNAYESEIGMTVGAEIIVFQAPKLLQVSGFRLELSELARNVLDRRIKDFKPEVVVAFDVVAAWVSQASGAARRVVWLGDLAFQTAFYHGLYAARESIRGALRFPKALLSSLIWRNAYKRAIRPGDVVLCAAHSPVEHLAKLGISSRYEPYPWPSSAGAERKLPTRPSFVFFGTLNALGSRSAIHFLLKRVYQHLRRIWGKGGFQILIAGRGDVPGWAMKILKNCPEVEYLGFVADLAPLLASCHAVVVPIDVPVGNRSRILTAMAMEVLVVAHQSAALGNPALKDGETCWLARNAKEFAGAMQRAVEDRESAERLIFQARRVYENSFSPDAACARFVRLAHGSRQEQMTETATVIAQ